MDARQPKTLGWDSLTIGEAWASPARTITEADIVNFAGMSGDFNALHMDHEAAKTGPFGRPVAHGLLGLSIASGLASQAPRLITLAFLGIREWQFREPILVGDTIQVVSRVEAIEPQARGRRALVTWHRRLLNQRGATAQEGRILLLIGAEQVGRAQAVAAEPGD
jgi:acyl dehydratase